MKNFFLFLPFAPLKTRLKLGLFGFLIFGFLFYILYQILHIVHAIIIGIQHTLQYFHPFFSSYIGYGISLILLLCSIYIIGIFVEKTETKLARLISKIPLVNKAWVLFKEAREAFHHLGNFLIVLIDDYPCPGVHVVALITGKTRLTRNGKKEFFPRIGLSSSPNPLTGQLLFVERDKLTLLQISSETFVKAIFSFGTFGPDDLQAHPDQSILDKYYRE